MDNPGSFKFYKNEKHSLQSIRKASDPIRKRNLHERFKSYRNLTTILTRVCKEDYYKSFFLDDKKDSKNMRRYMVNCECQKQKINTKHKSKYR